MGDDSRRIARDTDEIIRLAGFHRDNSADLLRALQAAPSTIDGGTATDLILEITQNVATMAGMLMSVHNSLDTALRATAVDAVDTEGEITEQFMVALAQVGEVNE